MSAEKIVETVVKCPLTDCTWHTRFTVKVLRGNDVIHEDPRGEHRFRCMQEYKSHYLAKHANLPTPIETEEVWE